MLKYTTVWRGLHGVKHKFGTIFKSRGVVLSSFGFTNYHHHHDNMIIPHGGSLSLFTSTSLTTSFRLFSQSSLSRTTLLDSQKVAPEAPQVHSSSNNQKQSSNSNGEQENNKTTHKGFSFLKFLKKLIKYMTISVASVMGLLAVCLPPALMVDFKEEFENDGYRAVLVALLDAYKDTWNIIARFTRSCYSIGKVMTIYRNLNKDFEPKFESISRNKRSDHENSSEEELQVLRDYVTTRRQANAKAAEILLDLCLHNGGAYVKAGQYIASLNYIMPKEITDILSVLQDKCQQHDFSVTEKILLEDLDRDYREIFSSFDTTPIASASIAQVHKATLRDGNQTVAVKIQHPDLIRIFKADLKTMQFLLFSTKLFFDFPFAWTLPEFERILLSELDFVNEAANCSHFSQMFKDYPDNQIDAPRVHWNLTSKRILTMDFIEGCKINDLQALKSMNIDPKEVAKLLVDSYSIQTFIHGFVHSDIHVGNLLVRRSEKNNKPQLIYLDHGCYKKLDEETRKDYCQLWKAAIFRDHENLKLYTEKFGIDGRFYPLFGLFLTFSNYMDKSSSSMVDQRKNMTSEEAKKMFKQIRETFFPKSTHKAQDLFNIIEEMFRNMKLDLILLMRANVQLRSITRELGRPINRFAIMAEYCLKGIHYERKNYEMPCIPHRESDQRRVAVTHVQPTPFFHQLTFDLFKFKLRLLVLDLAFVFFNLSMRILRYFNPSKYEEAEDDRETSRVKRRLDRMKQQKKAMEEDVASSKEDIEDLSAQQ
nr:unnamed protein product [Naegleria fowleri]